MQRPTSESTVSMTVVLDSGILLFYVKEEDEAEQKEQQCDVGFFAPTVIVYADGRQVERFRLPAGAMGQVVEVLHVDGSGAPKGGDIDVTKDLRRDLLRKRDIKYEHLKDIPEGKDFEQVFRFSSGILRPSSVKARRFKEMKGGDPPTHAGTFPSREIAHDIVFHYELEPGDELQLNIDKSFNWSTSKHPGVKRFDLEIIADHNTAEKYYCEAFGLKGLDHTLPNQGDPPPLGGKP